MLDERRPRRGRWTMRRVVDSGVERCQRLQVIRNAYYLNENNKQACENFRIFCADELQFFFFFCRGTSAASYTDVVY